MVDSLSKAAGEGITVELKGEVFKIKPLTIGDLSTFESYIRSQKIRDFLDVADSVEKDERLEVLARLAALPLGDEEISKAMNTMTGVQFLLWRSLKKSRDIELEDMDKYVDMSNFEDVSILIQNVGGGDEEEANPPQAQ